VRPSRMPMPSSKLCNSPPAHLHSFNQLSTMAGWMVCSGPPRPTPPHLAVSPEYVDANNGLAKCRVCGLDQVVVDVLLEPKRIQALLSAVRCGDPAAS
jgi:hypothetical protein